MRNGSRLLLAIGALAGLAGCGDSRGIEAEPLASCNARPMVAASAVRPQTIPALREWSGAGGEIQIHQLTRIVLAPANAAALTAVAETFAGDFAQLRDQQLPIVSTREAGAGDIALSLGDCDPRLGDEGYRLVIGEGVQIRAQTAAGAFYATRTLLQLARQGGSLPVGEALDWPRYPERGLMIDLGRQYFSPDWIAQHIKQLAYLKLNYFHFHLSDDQGFRIESESHPEVTSEPHLTKDEMRALIALAARYHVTLVPEIDMPGHMEAVLHAHPEFQLEDALGARAANRLDITNPLAVQFAHELIEEYLALFPGPYWHAGGDEYIPNVQIPLYPALRTHAQQQYGAGANAKDAIHGFINDIDQLVRGHGKTTRMWHDDLGGGSVVTVNPEIIVEWWTNLSPLSDVLTVTPQALLDGGHAVMNAGWFPTYYSIGPTSVLFLRPDMRTAYESWSVDEFYGPAVISEGLQVPPERVATDAPRNLGSKINVWVDVPGTESEAQIAEGIRPRLRVLAQKTWESPLLTPDYAGFLLVMDAVGSAPGFDLY